MRRLSILLALLFATGASAEKWSQPEYAGMLTHPDLEEVSGLAASRAHPGLYWAQNDGGNGSKLVAIKGNGSHVATLEVIGAENVDWEDIDSFDLDGKHYLLAADTGDNGGIRKQLTLYVIEEPARLRDGDKVRPAWTIEFRWPDGARDCEATAVDAANGEVLLISKKRVPPELFRLPLRPGDGLQTARLVTTLNGIAQPTEGQLKKDPAYGRYRSQISGADLSPNGRVLAVLNYHSIHLYARAPGQDWPRAMASRPGVLALPWLPQAEGITFSLDGRRLLVGSEHQPTPLLEYRVTP
ncbi:MAG: hypothetical protein KAY03_05350 [Arenimonas sp.]|nr:hypothetical protein [Arenimonas sp.]